MCGSRRRASPAPRRAPHLPPRELYLPEELAQLEPQRRAGMPDRLLGQQRLQALGVLAAEPLAGGLPHRPLDRVRARLRHAGRGAPPPHHRARGPAEVVGEEAVELVGEHDVDDRVGAALAVAYNVGEGGANLASDLRSSISGFERRLLVGVPGQEPQRQRLGVDRVVLHLPHAHGLAPARGEQRVHLEDVVAVGLEERDEVAPVVAGGLPGTRPTPRRSRPPRTAWRAGTRTLLAVAELEAEQQPLAPPRVRPRPSACSWPGRSRCLAHLASSRQKRPSPRRVSSARWRAASSDMKQPGAIQLICAAPSGGGAILPVLTRSLRCDHPRSPPSGNYAPYPIAWITGHKSPGR